MKVLITGASGFIGSLLTKTSVDRGHEVYAIVRSVVPDFPGNVYQIKADFTDSKWTVRLPDRADAVMHLAQSKLYRNFPDSSQDIFTVNVKATFDLLEWSRKQGVKKFIFSGTGNIYKARAGMLKETDPCLPSDMYAATKLCAEYLVQQYFKIFTTIICRIFTVYGPGQKKMLIPNLIDRVRKGVPITLARNIGMYLTPIHVGDVCEALIHLLENESIGSGSIFNIAGNKPISMKEIIEIISSSLGIKAVIEVTDGEVKSLCGNSYYIDQFIDSFKEIHDGLSEIIRDEYCR
ncbi:MAG: NAD-dependent epimerase/dehydratase family protein [Candidatus Hodarchaeota archaeon]